MLRSHVTTTRTLAMLAAGFMLMAATEAALARDNTGTRPVSSSATKGFGIDSGVGKGVGADGGVAMGGSSGGAAPQAPRRHHPWPHQD
jgi:hypothetical protein